MRMVAEVQEVREGMMNDEAFLQFAPKIKIIGVGGCGCNIADFIFKKSVYGAEVIAMNTDAAHLRMINAHRKIIIGKELTGGTGAGGDPEKGKLAAEESLKEIRSVVDRADLVFIVAGLGGGTGTGAAPIIAKVAKEAGALVIAFVIFPMKHEGTRVLKAIQGLNALREYANTVIMIDNEELVSKAGELPLVQAFNVANDQIASMIKGIVETITIPSMVNLDFADLKAIMGSGDVAMIGVGESDSENRAEEAVKRALENPLISVEIRNATGALVHITGGDDLTLREVNKVCEYVRRYLKPDAQLIWGVRTDDTMGRKMRVVVIITGVRSPYIFGQKRAESKKKEEEDLGIEFI